MIFKLLSLVCDVTVVTLTMRLLGVIYLMLRLALT